MRDLLIISDNYQLKTQLLKFSKELNFKIDTETFASFLNVEDHKGFAKIIILDTSSAKDEYEVSGFNQINELTSDLSEKN